MTAPAARPALAALALTLGACGGSGGEITPTATAQESTWRDVATEADRERLRGWWEAWELALAEARAAGHGAEIDAQGTLLVPDAALAGPQLPPGHYSCRTIKLGSKDGTGLTYVAYPPFGCAVRHEDGLMRLEKLTGSQRPTGRVYPDTDRRSVFLGTLTLGDEASPMAYGVDASRDMAGMVERIGPRLWRLVLPAPAFESKLDVIELVPAGG